MALQTTSISNSYLPDLILAVNAFLATLTTSYIRSVAFNVVEVPRVSSGELTVILVYESGAAAHSTYLWGAFADTNFTNVIAQAQAFENANPTYWFGPTIAQNFTESRRTQRSLVGFIYNTSQSDGQTYYVVGGTGGPAGGGGGGAVSSVFGRTGAVVAQTGDYTVTQITNAATAGANSNITSLSGLTTPLTIGQGGTGASTAAGARANLNVFSTTESNTNSFLNALIFGGY
jgi:hypothetical protein